MKTLYLLRHAKSDWGDVSLPDFERPLSQRGLGSAPKIGAMMREKAWIPEFTLCSAAVRAKETWALVMEAMGEDVPTETTDALYMTSPLGVLSLIATQPNEVGSILVVAHNPTMEALAAALPGDGVPGALDAMLVKYPTCALCVLEFPDVPWTDLEFGGGFLRAFVRPRDLD